MLENYRAWCWQQKGEPRSLTLTTKPMPAPAAGEVLVANRVIGLNPVDWKVIARGSADWQPGHVPGVDGVGRIAAVGAGVTLPVGARVAYHQGLARDGSFAEYTCVRADCLLPVPEGLDDRLAASLPCPGLTAWQAVEKVPAGPGRDVLVTGGGGAVGLFVTQLALARRWRVWVTADASHHQDLLSLGVAAAFDYHDGHWQDALLDRLGPRRIFAAFDTVSGEHARLLVPLIGYNGHLVCIQDRVETAPVPAFSTAISLHEVALNSAHRFAEAADWHDWRAAGRRMLEQLEAGLLRVPPIHAFGFDDLPQALTAVKARTPGGKIVVTL